jgi:hypothetical protein
MIQRNRSACKDVKIFIHHIGSKGAPRRGTVFFRGTNTKSREVSNNNNNDNNNNNNNNNSPDKNEGRELRKNLNKMSRKVHDNTVPLSLFTRRLRRISDTYVLGLEESKGGGGNKE